MHSDPRRAAERTNAAIDASVRELAGVSRLGIVTRRSATSRKHHLLLYIYLGPEILAVAEHLCVTPDEREEKEDFLA